MTANDEVGGVSQNKAVAAIVCAVWIALVALCARAIDFQNPYLPFAIGGAICFYLRVESSWVERAIWLLGSLGFLLVVPIRMSSFVLGLASLLAVFGLGALAVMGARVALSSGSERRRVVAQLGPALLVVFFIFSAQHALGLANLLHPKTYDLYLYAFDGSLGFQPSFGVARALQGLHWFAMIVLLVYLTEPLYMAVIYSLVQPKGTERPSWNVVAMMMLAGIGGWALFNFVPATGPRYAFSTFPTVPLPSNVLPRLFLEPIVVSGEYPRNAIPSLHVTWVLLLLWYARPLELKWKLMAITYTVLTVVATLATGEHYLVDLVVSLPFALLVRSLTLPSEEAVRSMRWMGIVAGLGGTFFWLALVRYGTKWMFVSPVVPWGLLVATLAGVFFLERRLTLPPRVASEEDATT